MSPLSGFLWFSLCLIRNGPVEALIGAVTHTTVKGISHVNEAVVNFNVDLVYLGNMWLHIN